MMTFMRTTQGVLLSILILSSLCFVVEAAVRVTLVEPNTIELQLNRPVTVKITGTDLHRARSVEVYSGTQRVAAISGALRATSTQSQITFTLKASVPPGTYSVRLSDGRRPIASVPMQVVVRAAAPFKKVTPTTARPLTPTVQRPMTAIPVQPAPVVKPAPTTSPALTSVMRITPSLATVAPGQQVTLTLEGKNLNDLSAVRIRQAGRDVAGFSVTLERPTAATQARRRVTIKAASNAAPGSYQLAPLAGRQSVAPPQGTIVSVSAPGATGRISAKPIQPAPTAVRPTTPAIQKPVITTLPIKPPVYGVKVTRIYPANIIARPGQKVTLTLEGQNLNRLSNMALMQAEQVASPIRFQSSLERISSTTDTRRRLSIKPRSAWPGDYRLALYEGNRCVELPSAVKVSVPAANTVTSAGATPACTTAMAGGSAGTRYDLACLTGEVVAGVHGKAGQWIDKLGLMCVKAEGGIWKNTEPTRRGSTGGEGGQSFTKLCPGNHAVSGFRGKAGQYIDEMEIQCRKLSGDNKVTGPSQYLKVIEVAAQPSGNLAQDILQGFGQAVDQVADAVAPPASFGPFSCPGGFAATGAFGKSGIYVDSFGLRCVQESAWRPAFHFAPQRGWMNDPAGLFYLDGIYHLYFQGIDSQPTFDLVKMQWRHATSEDLINWTEQESPAFERKTAAGESPFTGSGIVIPPDKTQAVCGCNTACAAAIFTRHKDGVFPPVQRQVMATSCQDGCGTVGANFRNEREVLNNDEQLNPNFRDPKVFWYAPRGYWVMVVAAGDRIKLFKSEDRELRSWAPLSDIQIYDPNPLSEFFSTSVGPFTETPDLVELPVRNSGERKWALLFAEGFIPPGMCRSWFPSTDPRGLANGACENAVFGNHSKSFYQIGDFDGIVFTPQGANPNGTYTPVRATAEKLDAGPDFYAPQTWSNAPVHAALSGPALSRTDLQVRRQPVTSSLSTPRRTLAGWQSNWRYAHALPTLGWRGSLSFPRELEIVKDNNKYYLVQRPVVEAVQKLRSSARVVQKQNLAVNGVRSINDFRASTYEVDVAIDPGAATEVGVHLRAGGDRKTIVGWRRANRNTSLGELFLDRRACYQAGGAAPEGFAGVFPPRNSKWTAAPLKLSQGQLKLRILVDRGSVEVFSGDGRVAASALTFPCPGSTEFHVYSKGGAANVSTLNLFDYRL